MENNQLDPAAAGRAIARARREKDITQEAPSRLVERIEREMEGRGVKTGGRWAPPRPGGGAAPRPFEKGGLKFLSFSAEDLRKTGDRGPPPQPPVFILIICSPPCGNAGPSRAGLKFFLIFFLSRKSKTSFVKGNFTIFVGL